jgi:SAM-dependent methyltransferase
MINKLEYTVINKIKCFSPEVANAYSDYPSDGFDLTDQNKNDNGSFWVNSRNRLFRRMVERNLPKTDRVKFLDIGCATGDFIRQIVNNKNLEITGSEIYLGGLQYAKENLPSVDFVQFDVTQGQIGDGFDMITAFDVVEHIENDGAAISNMYEMLNKNGTLIISVPQHMFLWSKLDEIVKHKRRYSRREMLNKLETNGFLISRTTSSVFALFPLMIISRMLDNWRDRSPSEERGLENRVTFSKALNWILDRVMRVDEILIGWGLSLPFGGTLVVVAKKR